MRAACDELAYEKGLAHRKAPSDIMRTLKSWTWPGNVGEFEPLLKGQSSSPEVLNSAPRWVKRGPIRRRSPGPRRDKD